MRRILLATVTAAALAAPAAARDGSGYVGVEGGALFARDTVIQNIDNGNPGYRVEIDTKTGYDLDIIAGYDFGFVRAEGELAWKRAEHDEYDVSEGVLDGDGATDVRSIMGNVLLDLGNDNWSFYAGGGAGWARVKNDVGFGQGDITWKDSGFAYQLIAGVRLAANEFIDVGLKYRFFDTQRLKDLEEGGEEDRFDFTSHSIMASFIYNWGTRAAPPPPPPPPPPAPPPPPPATQTCPDGTVILATDLCPPPPPPPPPLPEPERG